MDTLKGFRRSHYCGQLRIADVGTEASVCGWVQRQRDLGGLIFVDLRDRTGLVQLAFDDTTSSEIFEKAFSLRAEYVIAARGIIRERSSKNNEIPTGDVELEVKEVRLLAAAATPPFAIEENSDVNETLRLKYRYLDLRRPDMQPWLAGILHRQPVKIKPGVVADHQIKILSVKLRFQLRIFPRSGPCLPRFLFDMQVTEGIKSNRIAAQQLLEPLDFSGIRRPQQNCFGHLLRAPSRNLR